VTQTDNSAVASHSNLTAARLAWVVLILATLYICYFHNLGAIGFVGPDEPRYAWIARDMVETGDWVTPRLYGKPWFEKPVLYYWGAALSFRLFGVSEAAARFPSALAALFATLSIAWLGWRTCGAETARWLLLLLPTTVGMIGFSHAAAPDMPFAAMLTLAMVFAARLLGLVPRSSTSFTSSTSFISFFFGFFLGLAVLAKGPAAIILAGGNILLWAAFTKRWRDTLRCLHPIAIASFCLTALPWYILCAHRNPDFFRVFIIEHNFKRYLTPEFQHIQPFWFYVPVTLVAIFPWTILLIPVARKFFEEDKRRTPEFALELFLVCSPAFALFFFSISKSKLPGYILPAIPPLVLLLTEYLAAAIRNNSKSQRWVILALAVCLAVMGFAFPAASQRLPSYTDIRPAPEAMQLAVLAVLATAAIVLLGMLRRIRLALFTMIICLLLLIAKIDNFIAKIDPGLTARAAPTEASRLSPDFALQNSSTWQLNRSLFYQLNFYAHSVMGEWKPGEPKPEWLFVEPKREAEVRTFGYACPQYIVFPAVVLCRLTPSVDRLSGSSYGNSGDRQPR